MQKLDIKHYFNAIVSADDVKEHKPHPETFTLRRTGKSRTITLHRF